MSKKSRKKKKRAAAAAPKAGGSAVRSETHQAGAAPSAPPLGSGRVVRPKTIKVSAKDQAALAKKAARAKWAERMTAEGR